MNPLETRYTDEAMQKVFSDEFKFWTWRKCWIALAEAQYELGLEQVTPLMLQEMKAVTEINYEVAKEKEKEIRHDVMAHVYEFGTHCPTAKGIIHLGATSQFVCCHTDLIQWKEAIKIVKKQLVSVLQQLISFAEQHKGTVTLGYTHYQPAQPTTVGKRMTLYIQDLLMDLEEVERVEQLIKARGTKGTTGTQASYYELFKDEEKVKQLDMLASKKLGFSSSFPVTGQTYPRKIDTLIAKALAGIAESAHKFAVDFRLASNLRIMEEPFAEHQTGSSAMAYKRNPMRNERMTALTRKLIALPQNFAHTHANQWFERTLDDSAIRRIDIQETCLLTNAILKLYQNITEGMKVNDAMVKKYLDEELPFMATEVMLMELSKKGKDRQVMHELIKKHSVEAGNAVKEGKKNDLFERIVLDENIALDRDELSSLKNPQRFAGLAEQQTEAFLAEVKQKIAGKEGYEGTSLNV